MRLISTWPIITLALGAGCAAIQVRDQLVNARGRSIVNIDQASFDGENLHGRLLIGSDDAGYVVVRRNLREFSEISVDDVRDCDGGRTINYVQLDGVSFPPKPEELLVIGPGYWFGYDFSLLIYDDERFKKVPAPSCVQVDVGVHLEAAAPGTEHRQLTIQANLERAQNDAGAGMDAGASPATESPGAGDR
jgi:hypothetical protein